MGFPERRTRAPGPWPAPSPQLARRVTDYVDHGQNWQYPANATASTLCERLGVDNSGRTLHGYCSTPDCCPRRSTSALTVARETLLIRPGDEGPRPCPTRRRAHRPPPVRPSRHRAARPGAPRTENPRRTRQGQRRRIWPRPAARALKILWHNMGLRCTARHQAQRTRFQVISSAQLRHCLHTAGSVVSRPTITWQRPVDRRAFFFGRRIRGRAGLAKAIRSNGVCSGGPGKVALAPAAGAAGYRPVTASRAGPSALRSPRHGARR